MNCANCIKENDCVDANTGHCKAFDSQYENNNNAKYCPLCGYECDDVGCNGAGVYEEPYYECGNCGWEGTSENICKGDCDSCIKDNHKCFYLRDDVDLCEKCEHKECFDCPNSSIPDGCV